MLLLGWVKFCGLVAYNVSSVAEGQSAKLSKSNTIDSQTIDSNTGNYNTNISSCPTKIVTTITLTSRITLMKLITLIKLITLNESTVCTHTITTARAGACVEWIYRIKRV